MTSTRWRELATEYLASGEIPKEEYGDFMECLMWVHKFWLGCYK